MNVDANQKFLNFLDRALEYASDDIDDDTYNVVSKIAEQLKLGNSIIISPLCTDGAIEADITSFIQERLQEGFDRKQVKVALYLAASRM